MKNQLRKLKIHQPRIHVNIYSKFNQEILTKHLQYDQSKTKRNTCILKPLYEEGNNKVTSLTYKNMFKLGVKLIKEIDKL